MVKKKKKGFTLIELVAVIAILGILAVAIVPQVSKYIDKAKKTAIQAQCREIVTAVESYNAEADSTKQIGLIENREVLLAYSGDMSLKNGTATTEVNPTLLDLLTKPEYKKIQELLGKEKERFNKIPEYTKYSEILAVSQGKDFEIKKGVLSEVNGIEIVKDEKPAPTHQGE